MTHLPNVTVAIIDTKSPMWAIQSIQRTLKLIKPARTVFLTDIEITVPNVDVIKIAPIKSKKEYSEFCIKELYKYFDTTHVLVTQWDGFVLDDKAWTDEFLQYDYIGAPWVYDERNVGNGGFSLRSKRLQTALAQDNWIDVCHPEDQSICIIYRYYLEQKYAIKFAPLEVAERFAFETLEPVCPTFGFHNMAAAPMAYRPSVVVKRTGAMGDVIGVEPLLEYYYNKGYHVFLDTLPDFYMLFVQHNYPVRHVSELNPRVKPLVIDLDMAYEENPKQLHLKSYLEKAGIEDCDLRNPKLHFRTTEKNKLFKKYCVIHNDRRPQGGRNASLDWYAVVEYLNQVGYTVIQVGEGDSLEVTGAIKMRAATLNLLQFIIAGADLFVGNDSGPSHIAIAQGVPCVLFFGSVNPEYIHPERGNNVFLHNHHKRVCNEPFCWHSVVGCEGVECYIDEVRPPCMEFTTMQVIDAIKQVTK
jgi:hypothetical protein